jgi:hypothetical protein
MTVISWLMIISFNLHGHDLNSKYLPYSPKKLNHFLSTLAINTIKMKKTGYLSGIDTHPVSFWYSRLKLLVLFLDVDVRVMKYFPFDTRI